MLTGVKYEVILLRVSLALGAFVSLREAKLTSYTWF